MRQCLLTNYGLVSEMTNENIFPDVEFTPEFKRNLRFAGLSSLTTGELMDRADALQQLNTSLNREGFEAFYDEANICQLRNIKTKASSIGVTAPQRAWTPEERKIRSQLQEYLDNASEDEVTL